jgi:serine O-acetyltransferase
VVIGPATIGANCNLGHGATLGVNEEGDDRGCPVVGERVAIGPGAMVFGPVTIGNDAVVGANSVVTRDIPDRGVAVGVPAKVTSERGSFNLVRYAGFEADASRADALSRVAQAKPDYSL